MKEEDLVRVDVEFAFMDMFPTTKLGDMPEKIIRYAMAEIIESSSVSEGKSYYSKETIAKACEKAILHFVCCKGN